MVRLVTLYALALSVTAVLARPTHDLVPRHRAAITPRACVPKARSTNDTTDSGAGSGDNSDNGDDGTDTGDNTTKATDGGNTTKDGGDTTKDGGNDGTVISGAVPATFPNEGTVQTGWSVAPVPQKLAGKTKAFTLTDDTFTLVSANKKLSHKVVTHSNKKAYQAHFPKGAYDFQGPAGGLSFFTPGPKTVPALATTKAREVSFGYSIFFSAGFKFNMGGKLPGLYGGINDAVARTASGGNHPGDAFSCRFMFRDAGKGELYCYLPPGLNKMNFCGKSMNRKCAGATANGKTYGATIGTGAWMFKPGQWNALRQVLRLNDPGKKNGSMKVFANGDTKPIINLTGISFGNNPQNLFRGLQVQTFFGGHEPVWASPQNQDIFFSDFTVVVLDTF